VKASLLSILKLSFEKLFHATSVFLRFDLLGRPFYPSEQKWKVKMFSRAFVTALTTFGFVVIGLSSSYAQESDSIGYDEIIADLESNSPSSMKDTQFSTGLAVGDFQNVAYKMSGQIYSGSFQFTQPGDWITGIDIPYLVGYNTGEGSQELGNPKLRVRYNLWQMTEKFSVWIPASVRIGQRGDRYLLASHHDTVRGGLDFDYHRALLTASLGGGYQLRANEEDKRFDVGDIYDFHTSLRLALAPRWAVRAQLEWYRVLATKIRQQVVGQNIDWASVSPGVSYELTPGVNLTADVVFPVLQSGTPYETDLAFNEVYYPQTSSVTMGWGVGASF
jgi:hypothetical protein